MGCLFRNWRVTLKVTFAAIAFLIPRPSSSADEPASPPTTSTVNPSKPADLGHQPDTLDELKSAMEGFTEFNTFTCKGEVHDALYSSKPIAGAKVTILKLVNPQRHAPATPESSSASKPPPTATASSPSICQPIMRLFLRHSTQEVRTTFH